MEGGFLGVKNCYDHNLYFVKLDKDGRILNYNSHFEKKFLSLEKHEKNLFFYETACIEDAVEFKRRLNNCIQSPGLTVQLTKCENANEQIKWELFTHFGFDESPIINCWGVENDYSLNEFDEEESAHILKAIFDGTNDFKILVHPDLKLIFYNKRAFHLMKMFFDVELKNGADVENLISTLDKDVREPFWLSLNQAMNGQQIVREQRIFCETELWYQQIFSPVYYDEQFIGTAVIITDITERKIYEEKIKSQNKRLREIAFHQSHSMRKPLANIKGLLSLFDDKSLDEEQKFLLQKLNQSCEELDNVIHQTVLSAKEIEVELAPLNL